MKYELSKETDILIVGLGLIGGSYALALSKKGYSVRAITKDTESIEYAVQNGLIREGTTEVTKEYVEGADLVIFALYPTVFVEWIEKYADYFKKGALITDTCGVKGCIVDKIVSMLPDGVEFIGAHPMAGRELSGVKNADDRIFIGANYIITPHSKNTPDAIMTSRRLGEVLGFSNISELSVSEHDEVIGFLSQLTHCIAISLMTCSTSEAHERYTGDSFRDLTRIAKINDEMWSELFLMNEDALVTEMDRFISEFSRLKDIIKSKDRDTLREIMRESTARRLQFEKK